jgi:hypothetical protein
MACAKGAFDLHGTSVSFGRSIFGRGPAMTLWSWGLIMIRRTAIACVLMVLAAAPWLAVTPALAEVDPYAANNRLPGCKGFLDPDSVGVSMYERGVCAGVVEGIVYMSVDSRDKGSCSKIPLNATTAQMVRVVVRYIEARPQRMHETFAGLVIEALMDAWPCSSR